jgi:hypothetical protein
MVKKTSSQATHGPPLGRILTKFKRNASAYETPSATLLSIELTKSVGILEIHSIVVYLIKLLVDVKCEWRIHYSEYQLSVPLAHRNFSANCLGSTDTSSLFTLHYTYIQYTNALQPAACTSRSNDEIPVGHEVRS